MRLQLLLLIGALLLAGCAAEPAKTARSPAVLMEDVQVSVDRALEKLEHAEPLIEAEAPKSLVAWAITDLSWASLTAKRASAASVKQEKQHEKEKETLEKKIAGLSDPVRRLLNGIAAGLIAGGIVASLASIWYGGRLARRLGLLAVAAGLLIATTVRFLPAIEWIIAGLALLGLAFAVWRWRAVWMAGLRVVQSIEVGKQTGLIAFAGRSDVKGTLDSIQGTEGKALVDAGQARAANKRVK